MLEQFILIAVIQGITEFLPISSQGHINLLHLLTPLDDQGLTVDVAVHLGTVVAVFVYNWREIKRMIISVLTLGRDQRDFYGVSISAIIATIPVVIAGYFLNANDAAIDLLRNVEIVAWSTLIFGIILGFADRSHGRRQFTTTHLGDAITIGFAQVLALIPGTSRAGITMTAARLRGLSHHAAARFSMVLSIPVIIGSAVLKGGELASTASADEWLYLFVAAILSMVIALLSIGVMMAVIQRVGFMPFVIYRVILGAVLLASIYLF
jgi:undecaprenyl-diphosphatase